MITLKIITARRTFTYSFPSAWEELSEKQKLSIFKINSTVKKKEAKNAKILHTLFPKLYKRLALLPKEQRADCLRMLSRELNHLATFTMYLPPRIGKYEGKGEHMRNITFRQWADADLQFWLFQRTEKKEHIYTMCSILYNMPIEKARKLRNFEVDAIIFYYLSCKTFILKLYSENEFAIFKPATESTTNTKPHNYDEDLFILMQDCAYKSKKEIEESTIIEIFDYLTLKEKQKNELNARLRS